MPRSSPVATLLRPAPKVLLRDTWPGVNGAAWDTTKWVTDVRAGGTVDIQSSAGRLQAATSAYNSVSARGLMPLIMHARVDGTVTLASTVEQYVSVWLRGDGFLVGTNADNNNGYRMEIRPSDPGVNVERFNADVATNLALGTWAAVTTKQRFRFEVFGYDTVTVRCKLWTDGTAMPVAWTATAADTSGSRILTPGIFGLGFYNGGAASTESATWDDLVVTNLQGVLP
jgi:hypothetical protein